MSELIEQGGYGCIFYPGLNCASNLNKTSSRIASKLQRNDFNAINEKYIGSLIQQIPNYKLYFLPVISSCSISLAKLNKDQINKCKVITSDTKDYILLEFPYLKNISFKQLFADPTRTTRHLFLTFIETYSYISIAICSLLERKIVHFDIKEGNVLYSTKYENPILIDFGLSIPIENLTTDTIREYFYGYFPEYSLWPIEVHTINYILYKEHELNDANIKDIVHTYVKYNIVLSIFSDEFKERYINSAITFLTQYIDKDRDLVINELITTSYKTWDLYALSIMYLKFLRLLFKDGFFENLFIIRFTQLLANNISPFPAKRFTTAETCEAYNDIFFINEKPINYLTLIKELNI